MKTFTWLLATIIIFSAPVACSGEAWDRDPFEFDDKKKVDDGQRPGSLFDSLTLILVNAQIKIAIIGGSKYKIGSVIEGSVITGITIDSVETKSDEGTKIYFINNRRGR